MTAQEIIKEIMKQQGLSQYALSSMAVMKRTTLKTMLLPNRNIMTDTVYRLVKVLKGELVIGGIVMGEKDEKDIVRELMGDMSMSALSAKAGYSSRASVRMLLTNKTSIRMDALVRLITALGGKVIIRCNGEEWEVS